MAFHRLTTRIILVGTLSFPLQFNAFAASTVTQDIEDPRPGIGAMIGDALVARPLLLATTALGTAAFAVSLPFTIMGGKVKEAAHTLIIKPADETFMRCLGCTPIQDKYKNDPFAQNEKHEVSE